MSPEYACAEGEGEGAMALFPYFSNIPTSLYSHLFCNHIRVFCEYMNVYVTFFLLSLVCGVVQIGNLVPVLPNHVL